MEFEHGLGEVRAPDGVLAARQFGQVVHGDPGEALVLEHADQGSVAHVAVSTQGDQLELQGVVQFEGQEVRQDVHVARAGSSVAVLAREAVVAKRDLGPRHVLDALHGAGRRHAVVAGGGVVVGQGDRRNAHGVGFPSQFLGRVGAVGERRMGVKIDHLRSVLSLCNWLSCVWKNYAVPSRSSNRRVEGT